MFPAQYLSILIAGLCAGRAAGAAVREQKTHSEGSLAKDLERLITEQKTHSEGSLAEDSERAMAEQMTLGEGSLAEEGSTGVSTLGSTDRKRMVGAAADGSLIDLSSTDASLAEDSERSMAKDSERETLSEGSLAEDSERKMDVQIIANLSVNSESEQKDVIDIDLTKQKFSLTTEKPKYELTKTDMTYSIVRHDENGHDLQTLRKLKLATISLTIRNGRIVNDPPFTYVFKFDVMVLARPSSARNGTKKIILFKCRDLEHFTGSRHVPCPKYQISDEEGTISGTVGEVSE